MGVAERREFSFLSTAFEAIEARELFFLALRLPYLLGLFRGLSQVILRLVRLKLIGEIQIFSVSARMLR